jgi:hypothetical protein
LANQFQGVDVDRASCSRTRFESFSKRFNLSPRSCHKTLLYPIHVMRNRCAKIREFRGILLQLKIRDPRSHIIGRRRFLSVNFFRVHRVDVLAWKWNGNQHNCYQEEDLPRGWHGYDLPRIIDWPHCTKRGRKYVMLALTMESTGNSRHVLYWLPNA